MLRWCRPVKHDGLSCPRGKPSPRVQIPTGAPRDIMSWELEEELERKLERKLKKKKYRAVYRKVHKKGH